MIDSVPAIALVTPLKNEITTMDRFFKSIKEQSIFIKCLVIIENDSTDGSKEYLENMSAIDNVGHFKVLNITFEDTSYRVGKKYARIVSAGFNYLRELQFYDAIDFIGILDCDVFPEQHYYRKLVKFLIHNPDVGITSGLIYTDDGKLHIANTNWVRGGCRLWKKECFDDAGYLVAYTADTVSVALAHLKGWKTATLKSARVISREVNVRMANNRNKGFHAYYRGHTLFYMVLKSLHLAIRKGRVKMGYDLLIGFLDSLYRKRPRIEDKELRNYFRFYMFNKLIGKY